MIITYQNKVTRYYCDYFESFYMFANLYWKGKETRMGFRLNIYKAGQLIQKDWLYSTCLRSEKLKTK